MKKLLLSWYNTFLRRCARRVIQRTHPYVVGVTGSVGKTTVRLIVTQTIQQLVPGVSVLTSPKNFNGDMGFSLSILGIDAFTPSFWGYIQGAMNAFFRAFFAPAVDVMVLEYGIDYPGEMLTLLSVVKPHIGIITCIDAVHSEQIGNPTKIAEEKRHMIDQALDVVFLNIDDIYVKQMNDRTAADVFWYSIQQSSIGDVGYVSHMMEERNDLLISSVSLFAGDYRREGTIGLVSSMFVSYVSIGLSVASLIAHRCQQDLFDRDHLDYILQPGRLSFLRGIEGSMIVDSSYNASPKSMESMLGVTYRIKHDVYMDDRPMIGIIGDMRELGDLSEQAHRLIAGILSQCLDQIVLVGQEVHYTMNELEKIGYPMECVCHFVSSREAGNRLKERIITGEVASSENEKFIKPIIFVKGSQNTIYLEEAIKSLLANHADIAQLGRQDRWWMEKKEKFFHSVEK